MMLFGCICRCGESFLSNYSICCFLWLWVDLFCGFCFIV